MKKFDLNIEKVLEHWETSHALREIIANALDESLLTQTANPEIYRDDDGVWYIKDLGRGLAYEHLTQNESDEKRNNPHKVIGKFGVGLKDALATFNRNEIGLLIRSMHSDIYIEKSSKTGFDDITTLHAIVEEPSFPDMQGTEFSFNGIQDEDMAKAKDFFLKYSGETILEQTKYGELVTKKNDLARIYVNGLCVATEDNFLFSYNITSPTKKLLRSLNRERTNVGRTAYSDRVKSILLECNNTTSVQPIVEDLERIQKGDAHDELQWVDVQLHACKVLNKTEKVLFLTSEDMRGSQSKYVEYALDEGRRIITVPENLADKLSDTKDGDGQEMMDLTRYTVEWNQNFEFDFINESDLTVIEKDVFFYKATILKWIPKANEQVDEILISNVMRPDDYTGSDSAGLWQPEHKRIIIHRNQLSDIKKFAGTLIHELVHATTGADDHTLYFENELTKALGELSLHLINETSGSSKKAKGFFGLFK